MMAKGGRDMIYLIYAVVLLVYWVCPKRIQVVMLLINLFVPDAIPVVDELIMVAGLLKSSD